MWREEEGPGPVKGQARLVREETGAGGGQRTRKHKDGTVDGRELDAEEPSRHSSDRPVLTTQPLVGPLRRGGSVCGGWAPEGRARGKGGTEVQGNKHTGSI